MIGEMPQPQTMDSVSALYYAIVCAVLAGTVPPSVRPLFRYGIGALVGLIAAVILPWIREAVMPVATAPYGG